MSTENTHLTNVTPVGDSNPSVEIGIVKGNIYQRPFLIVASSLLTLLVWIAVTGKSGGHQLTPSAYEMADGAVALTDNQVDTAQSVLIKDIFRVNAVSKNEEGKIGNRIKNGKKTVLHFLLLFIHLIIYIYLSLIITILVTR